MWPPPSVRPFLSGLPPRYPDLYPPMSGWGPASLHTPLFIPNPRLTVTTTVAVRPPSPTREGARPSLPSRPLPPTRRPTFPPASVAAVRKRLLSAKPCPTADAKAVAAEPQRRSEGPATQGDRNYYAAFAPISPLAVRRDYHGLTRAPPGPTASRPSEPWPVPQRIPASSVAAALLAVPSGGLPPQASAPAVLSRLDGPPGPRPAPRTAARPGPPAPSVLPGDPARPASPAPPARPVPPADPRLPPPPAAPRLASAAPAPHCATTTLPPARPPTAVPPVPALPIAQLAPSPPAPARPASPPPAPEPAQGGGPVGTPPLAGDTAAAPGPDGGPPALPEPPVPPAAAAPPVQPVNGPVHRPTHTPATRVAPSFSVPRHHTSTCPTENGVAPRAPPSPRLHRPLAETPAQPPTEAVAAVPPGPEAEVVCDLRAMSSLNLGHPELAWEGGASRETSLSGEPPMRSPRHVTSPPAPTQQPSSARRSALRSALSPSPGSSGGSLQRTTWSPTRALNSTQSQPDGNGILSELGDLVLGDLRAISPVVTPGVSPLRPRKRVQLVSPTARDKYRDEKVELIQWEMQSLDIVRLQTEIASGDHLGSRQATTDSDASGASDEFGW